MYQQSMFLRKNKKNIKKESSENEHFFSCEIMLYIAWACLRNANVGFLGPARIERLTCRHDLNCLPWE